MIVGKLPRGSEDDCDQSSDRCTRCRDRSTTKDRPSEAASPEQGAGYQTTNGRPIPIEAEVGWILDGAQFIYWRARIESWSLEA